MIKEVEGEMNGTKDMSKKHFIDSSILSKYLEKNIPNFSGSLKIKEFIGGQSNPTYLLKTENSSYVLRRKPPGVLLKTAHAVDREFEVISALNKTNVPVPKAYIHCEDEDLIGTEFFVMEYIDGTVIWESHIPHGSETDRFEIYASMNETIANLHSVDPYKIGLENFGKPMLAQGPVCTFCHRCLAPPGQKKMENQCPAKAGKFTCLALGVWPPRAPAGRR